MGAEEKKNEGYEEENKETGVQDQTGNANGTSGDNGTSNETGASAEKTFNQRQVSSMMAREKSQGRASAYREMGIDPNDSKMVNMFKAFIASQKTDEQKVQEEQAAQATKIAEAEHRAMVAEAKAEAMQLGALPQYVDDLITLVMAKDSGDDKFDVKSVIGELKSKYPAWFSVSADDDKGKGDGGKHGAAGQKGTGSSVGGTGSKGDDSSKKTSMGQRLAAQRRNNNNKNSFWS